MKLGFMTFACPQWSLDRVLRGAKEHGYQGVEVRCDAKQAHGVEVWSTRGDRARIRRQFERNGVELCCLATGLQLTQRDISEAALQRFRLASSLGCPGVRVFCGPPALRDDVAGAVDAVTQRLIELAPLAEENQVQIWLETHDTMSRASLAAQAVRRANRINAGINYDNLHPYRTGESLQDTFTALSGLIRHCHFHDALNSAEQVVITPFGKGQMPMEDMLRALAAAGYDGYLSGEWFHDQYGEDPNEALDRYHRDVTTLAERVGVTIQK